jgi:hypothetical protein
VGPIAALVDVEKRKFLTPQGLELRSLGHPACSQSLYQLCYHGSSPKTCMYENKNSKHFNSREMYTNAGTKNAYKEQNK